MNLIRFRVIIDIEEDVFRDILIGKSAPLEDLHRGILAAFDFGEGEMASFFKSDEDWGRGREVPLMDMGTNDAGDTYPSMRSVEVGEMVAADNDRMVYVYDFLRMWCFYVEVVGMEEGEVPEYPMLAEEFGKAPDQFSKEVDLLEGIDEPAPEDDGPLRTGDPELDAYLNEGEEDEDDGPSFTSLDDLDEAAY
ncbi:plasmid pRiA4b ORF-3 family protein [Flavobacteriales bacterium]|nr:plasmid pRiA4b ORF-3 family protein [Flavobacteriales bacterium]